MHRMSELEGARGFLAVWVVIVHLIPAVGFDAAAFGIFTALFSDGIRVKIFCAMSGFVIFIMLERTEENYFKYITKRFLRLYPAYLVFFVVSVLLVDVYIIALENNPFNGKFNLQRLEVFRQSRDNAPQHIGAHLTMLHSLVPHSILPSASYAFLGQAWNITYEWVFYLCAPLMFWIASKSRMLAIGGALLYICAYFLSRPFVTLPLAAQYVSWFMMGILSYYIWIKVRTTGLSRPSLWAVASSAVLYAATKELAIAIWAVVFISILGAMREGATGNIICSFLKSKPLLYLGKISYSIYLVHMIPLFLAMYTLNQGEYSHTEYVVYLVSATFIATLAISVLAFKYIEQPAIQLGKAVVGSRRLNRFMQGSVG
jgi:peptidoglycan/LPS O-acetylase OafA/YrhL